MAIGRVVVLMVLPLLPLAFPLLEHLLEGQYLPAECVDCLGLWCFAPPSAMYLCTAQGAQDAVGLEQGCFGRYWAGQCKADRGCGQSMQCKQP